MNKHFVCTSDAETAKQLEKELHLVQQSGKYWVFVNDVTMNFSERVDQKQLMYTNKLCI